MSQELCYDGGAVMTGTTRTLADVPEGRRCGAKTRAGTPCKKWSLVGRTRCRLHGGKSLGGYASPRFVHGWYSNDPLCRLRRAIVEDDERRRARVAARLEAEGYRQDLDGTWRRHQTDSPRIGGNPMDGLARAL